jgi:hypothetical protein
LRQCEQIVTSERKGNHGLAMQRSGPQINGLRQCNKTACAAPQQA